MSFRFGRACVLSVAGVVLICAPAMAQNAATAGESAALRLGPVGITPRFGLRDLGIDTNVFNLSGSARRDSTATFVAGTDTWVRVGRADFTGKTDIDWHYFRTSADQRTLNFSQTGHVEVDLFRLVPRAGGAFLNSRQRPNDEIDVRVQQRNVAGLVGVLVPVGSRSRLDFEWKQQTFDYSTGRFGSEPIAAALNRTSTTATLTAGYDLTPLTKVVVQADTREDRFSFTPVRNSDSLRVMPGLEFEPTALISGKVLVGYRRFRTPSAAVPDLTGLVASVELKYVAADAYRITGQINRDVDYSLDPGDSIYVSSSLGLDLARAVNLSWDVVGRVRHATLNYKAVVPAAGRVDRTWTAGAGVGRRLGTRMRVGIDADFVSRASPRRDRTFEGMRYGVSVTYGY